MLSGSHRRGYTRTVDVVALRTAKDTLSALVERVADTHERVTITRNGHAAAVLISPDDLAALEETLDVLSDPATMARLRESQAELSRGDVLDGTELHQLLARIRH